MLASTSTSKRRAAALALALLLLGAPLTSRADDVTGDKASGATERAEDEDLSETPFTEFGEFNEADDEAHNIEFFQNGRFFGVSAGVGFHDVLGNRGLLWKGGFPFLTFKLHAWFDLKVGIQLYFATAKHSYEVEGVTSHTDSSVFQFGADFKYYLGTKDVTAAVAFANPYVLVGGATFTKNEFDQDTQTETPDSTFGVAAGFGLEFAISPKRSYFTVETKAYLVPYNDAASEKFAGNGIPDLSGLFYSVTGNFMFTW